MRPLLRLLLPLLFGLAFAYPNMLTPAQVSDMTEYVVALSGRPADAAAVGRSQQLYADNCAACHGEGLLGQDQFPRLAGQGHDYLLAQLDAFAQGRRQDPTGAMTAISATLSAEDRQALAHYLAALAPVAQ